MCNLWRSWNLINNFQYFLLTIKTLLNFKFNKSNTVIHFESKNNYIIGLNRNKKTMKYFLKLDKQLLSACFIIQFAMTKESFFIYWFTYSLIVLKIRDCLAKIRPFLWHYRHHRINLYDYTITTHLLHIHTVYSTAQINSFLSWYICT